MAATKRALAIRAKKDGITQQINSFSDQMRSIRIDRIPQSIVNGSFQRAVEFKTLVELCAAPPPLPCNRLPRTS